ncbi:MAG TPA: 4a-hydroxytetrahydrobiopterin dehydratase [Brevefilum sp.]|nr:4a-hydroxytetrahydrobiopterin dehydratase [Brevefilum sp.]
MMTRLADQNCVQLTKESVALSDSELAELRPQIPEWEFIYVDGVPRLRRTFKFKNFLQALEFTNAIGKVAEQQGHHPLIALTWGQTTVDWWTHDISGLHKNDFIMAAKSDVLYG